ncbi:hypothetical protein GS436_16035 [Rhodococcus hoagii]|nr:hypothetical protein [Prescottella equi]
MDLELDEKARAFQLEVREWLEPFAQLPAGRRGLSSSSRSTISPSLSYC